MNKALQMRNSLVFPTNVKILYKSTDGRLIRESAIKNMVLKEYGLYSYVRFILGSFNNGAIWDWKQYVPKFLAVGSNLPPSNGAPGTDTAVKITDISLYNELDDSSATGESSDKVRIKLKRANYVEDNESENFLKIQYEAYIPEDRFVNMTIGELGLMTGETGWNAYARVSGFEPFVKEPRTVVQVIWEITIISIESSKRFLPPIKQYLLEAVEKAIDVLYEYTEDPIRLKGARRELEKLIIPSTNTDTGLYYLLNENEMITQDVINNYLSKPFVSIYNTGLIPLINKFDPNWKPSSVNWNAK